MNPSRVIRILLRKGSECVRLSKSLNKGENAYIEERKVKIEKCLEENGINFKVARVPHIAVLGSGGGERAMVGILGCLDQMGQDNLLDSALYLCGVSGSTWCMSMLYEDPAWSSNLLILIPKLITRLTKTIDFSKIIGWLTEAIKYDNYSLTDFWAATVTYSYVKEMDRSHLSEQKQRDTTNPYPIYTVVDKGLKQDGQTAACWFELSPHEAGYSHLGAFVDTSAFGSKFEAGVLKENIDQMDILYLQGLCGSALADSEEDKKKIFQMILDWIKRILHHGGEGHDELSSSERGPCDCQACTVIDTLLQLHDNPEDYFLLESLQQIASEVTSKDHPIVFTTEDVWQKMSAEERNKYFAVLTTEVCNSLSSWFSDLCNVAAIIVKTWPLIFAWRWGTQFNFLYKYPTGDGKVPDVLLSDERRYLEDAGLLWNSPYVAALRPARKVDLILSFDFSDGDPFLTVTQAADYCKQAGIPFPTVAVPEEERKKPKDFYVFKGKDGPTVIHIPLFNIVSCEGDVEKWRKRYSTFQTPYDKQAIEDLLHLSTLNVSNNKKRILEEIQAAC